MIEEKLIQIAENEPMVYEAGKAEGIEQGIEQGSQEGYTKGYEAGRKAEYDAFWDTYQDNGNRTEYAYAFGGAGWNAEIFKPKYDIKPVGTSSSYMMLGRSTITNLVEQLDQCGVVLDFSGVTGYESYTFYNSKIEKIGKVDLSNATHMMNTFSSSNRLHTIEDLHVSDRVNFITPFLGCISLIDLLVTGTIGQNGFDVSPCTKLSKASIESIIGCLSTTTSGLSVTLSKTAVTSAFGSITSEEWLNLVATRSNWTISTI